jgi:uncharacterized protein (TIGR02611 family)
MEPGVDGAGRTRSAGMGGKSTKEGSPHSTQSPLSSLDRSIGAIRAKFHAIPAGSTLWRVLIGVLGLVFVLVGLLLVPLPGPGWLVVLAGVAIWSVEFAWARRLLRYAREQLHRWNLWMRRQSWLVRAPLLLLLLAILLAVAWLSSKHLFGFDPLERVLGLLRTGP